MALELRHIRYFLAVAEEGNFTRAAARLGIGQPPLSMQIKALEDEVGARLFHRVPHGAELTEAGRAFLDAVRPMPGQAEDAIRAAQRASRGETGALALGFTGSSALHPAIPEAIRAFRKAFPEVDLKLDEANSMALASRLREGRLDLAVIRPSADETDDLVLYPWLEELFIAALPASHPAAGFKGAIDLEAISDRPLILTPREVGVSLHDAALAACREAGFEPVLGQPAPQIASILSLVAADLGVSLVPDSARQLALAGVVYKDIARPKTIVRLALAHRRGEVSRLARNFISLVRAT